MDKQNLISIHQKKKIPNYPYKLLSANDFDETLVDHSSGSSITFKSVYILN